MTTLKKAIWGIILRWPFMQLFIANRPHNLAFNDNDPSFIIAADASGMLQNIGAKLANEPSLLVKKLDLENRESIH